MRRGGRGPSPNQANVGPGYDQRIAAPMHSRAGPDPRQNMAPDYGDIYMNPPVMPGNPIASPPHVAMQQMHQPFLEPTHPHHHPHHPRHQPHVVAPPYRDHHRIPSTYMGSIRESPYPQQGPPPSAHRLYSHGPTSVPPNAPILGSPPYKILCITNINHKIGDIAVKEALTNDFSRFGDISISICHDNGERLAYIYFRTYEEAREARHTKTGTLLFDRPVEIEPIYEPNRASPIDNSSPPPSVMPMSAGEVSYGLKRHSMTPPEYHEVNMYPSVQYGAPSPPLPQSNSMPYGRQYYPSSHSSYSPPHDQYRPYHQAASQLQPSSGHTAHYQPSSHHHHYSAPYGPPSGPPAPARPPSLGRMERESRLINDPHPPASPRSDPYYSPAEHRGNSYSNSTASASSAHHSSRLAKQSRHQPPILSSSPSATQHHQSSSTYRSPPYAPANSVTDPLPMRYMSREYRREKFGSEHYNSEHDDGRPSRVLIVNDIDPIKDEHDVREIFDVFGLVEEVELRKIGPETAVAFVRFSSMDGAYKAKTATNGRHIGNSRCRIVYGKMSASRRLWIGGLSPSTTLASLEDACGRFGDLISVDYTTGRPYSYIEYKSSNQAQFAAHHLKSLLTPAPERKIRIEFVDLDKSEKISRLDSGSRGSADLSSRSRTTNESWSTNELEPSPQSVGRKRSITPPDISNKKRIHQENNIGNIYRSNERHMGPTSNLARSRTQEFFDDRQQSVVDHEFAKTNNTSNNNNDNDIMINYPRETVSVDGKSNLIPNSAGAVERRISDTGSSGCSVGTCPQEAPSLDQLVTCKSIREIVQYCAVSWSGLLVLRNFNFPSKLFMCSGQKSCIDKYLSRLSGDESHSPILRITQRWRLHPQPKLEEVKRRMLTANFGMLIITSCSLNQLPAVKNSQCTASNINHQSNNDQSGDERTENDDANKTEETSGRSDILNVNTAANPGQSRSLKNLISYLEQKDAAGVISLSHKGAGFDNNNSSGNDNGSDGCKLLYVFPPGDFALNLLKRKSPDLTAETIKEEFLLGVIVGGTDAKLQ